MVEYTYNELNQLVGYIQPNDQPRTYMYDGTGMRVSSSDGYRTTKYYWDRGYVANETYQDNISATNYIGSQGIFARTYDGETNYLFKNGHGDVTNTAKNGVKGYSYKYDAYGKADSSSSSTAVPMRYASEYVDSESGLIYLRNRYYDPSIQRFITEDPHWNPNNMIYGDKEYRVGEIKVPDMNAIMQSSNLYAYCMNNPNRYVDPTGKIVTITNFSIGIGFIAGIDAQALYVFDDEGNKAMLLASDFNYSIGASAKIQELVFPDVPTVEDFLNSDSATLGLTINGKGGGISSIRNGDNEYTGIYVSYGTGLEVELDAGIGLFEMVLWKNF